MPKYKINYTIEKWYKVEVEASSEEEARNMFIDNEIDYELNEPELFGEELQDNWEVYELEEGNE